MYTLRHRIEFVQRLLLQVVAVVHTEVLCLACPRKRIWRRDNIACRHLLCRLGRRAETHFALQYVVRQGFEELEYTRPRLLANTKCIGTDPYINKVFTLGQAMQLVRILLRIHRIIVPIGVREMETQFITQSRIAHKHLHLGCSRRCVEIVG